MKRDADMQNRVIAAVECIESVSSIEVVVTLSPRTVPATVPVLSSALATGILFLALYHVIYAAATAGTIVTNTIAFSAGVALLVGSFPQLQRLLIPAQRLRNAALAAARAEFVRQGVHCTRNRTGLLLYLSVFERQALLVADSGIRAMIPPGDLERLEQEAAAIFGKGDPGQQLTLFFASLQQVAGRYLPRGSVDINELDNGLRS